MPSGFKEGLRNLALQREPLDHILHEYLPPKPKEPLPATQPAVSKLGRAKDRESKAIAGLEAATEALAAARVELEEAKEEAEVASKAFAKAVAEVKIEGAWPDHSR